MDPKKQVLVNSIISFLQDELHGNLLNEEKKESIEVAVQCLETAFDIENQTNSEKVDLLSLINIKTKIEVSEEQKLQAEEHKTKGNNFMKNDEYEQAVLEYTKAIELNRNNAIYYCNRAAAYTKLLRDTDAITDCNEAINLDPTYGKAYSRLGIAYSNLNKYDLAINAYQMALKFDPNNTMYQTNLKVAEERLTAVNPDGATPSAGNRPLPDISQFLNNPNIINMASQILSDPNFCNMMSGIINMGGTGDGMTNVVETMLQAGQTLAQRVANEDPNFYNRITRNINQNGQDDQGNSDPNAPTSQSGDQPPENKDEGSA